MKKYIYAAVAGTLAFFDTSGQNLPLHKTITGTESGTIVHQAQLSIKFDKNYTYLPNGGYLKAEIINPTTGNIAYQDPVNLANYTINTALPVGTLSDELQVNGFLNYSVNFDVPQGAAGLQPTLGLTYTSHFVDGMVGIGFNLTGLSAITRTVKNIYHDGVSTPIAGLQSDSYALDGNRLLLDSGTYGADGSIYGTEMEGFSKIVAAGSSSSNKGPLSFLVYTKSGLIMEYGNTIDSRIMKNSTTVLVWKLNKISDHFGNSITYKYYEHDDEHPIHKIGYNYGYPAGSDPGAEITFRYKRRADKSVYVSGGKSFTRDLLLDNIEITNNGQSHKTYEFNYLIDSYSQIQEIVEYSSAGQKMNPTVFNWTPEVDAYSQSNHYSNSTNERYYHGDFNGDGITDFVTIPDKTSYSQNDKFSLWVGTSNGTMIKKAEYFLKSDFGNFITGDFNGDGITDLVMVQNINSYTFTFYRSTGLSFVEDGPSWSLMEAGYYYHLPVDYNGDGVVELFLFKPQHIGLFGQLVPSKYKLYSATGTFIHDKTFQSDDFSAVPDNKLPFYPDKLLDINGDGRTDIIQRTSSGFNIYEFKPELTKTIPGSNFNINNSILFGDFNGDGSDDILKTSGPINPVWSILYYTQSGFQEKIITHMPNLNLYYFNNNYFCQDINGDGKMDIIVWGKGTDLGNNNNRIYIAINKGNGYEYDVNEYVSSVTWDMEPSQNEDFRFFFGDYNGDGRQQFFYKKGSTSRLYSFFTDTPGHLLKTIINGHGAKTTIAYTPMSSASVYTKGTGATFPLMDAGASIQLVSSVATDNGTATPTTVSYSYNGAKVHQEGKGFLGFSKITALNSANGVTTESNFTFENTNYYSQLSSITRKKGGIWLSSENFTWEKQTIFGKRIFPYLFSHSKTDHLTGQNSSTSYYYKPSHGNIDFINTVYASGHTAKVQYTYNNELPDNPKYLIGRPTTIDETYTREGVTTTKKITRTYSQNSNAVILQTHNPGDAAEWKTEFEYDNFGNVNKETIMATGIASQVNEFTYDDKGVTLVKVKDVNLGNENNYTYYAATGLLYEQSDAFGNKTTYSYNNADQPFTIAPANGVTRTITSGYNISGGPTGARYYMQVSGSDGTLQKSWHNITGAEIRTEAKGFSGTMIKTDRQYLADGRLDRFSEPTTGTPSNWNTLGYGNSDNQYNLFTPKFGPQESFSFNGALTFSKSVNSRTYSTTYANDGSVVSGTDPGGTLNYQYWPAGELKSVSTPEGMVTTMTYDKNGNRLTIDDPSAGLITNTWYGNGRQKTMVTANGDTTTWYYKTNGLPDYTVTAGKTTSYTYTVKGQVESISSPDGVSRTYSYYPNGRLQAVSESVGGVSNLVAIEYDSYGRVGKKTFNSSAYEEYEYQNGYLYRIKFNGTVVWQVTTIDEYNRLRAASVGGVAATWGYSAATNLLSQIKATGVQQYDYSFDGATGNLNSRQNSLRSLTESFGYDTEKLDRLTSVTGPSAQTIGYHTGNKGNKSFKSDVGIYDYDPAKKYRLNRIFNGVNISTTDQDISYTAFNKVQQITEGTKTAEFIYNADNQRIRMTLKNNGSVTKTRWYFGGSCEREQVGSTVTQYIWIGGDAYTAVAVAKKTGTGSWVVYHIFRDHLGTITHLKNGSTIDEYSFDAWGRRRDKDNWSYTLSVEPALFADRGFTGHEFLEDFNLYNMNGRLYDPILGRFLSPDPYIADPSFTQSYNRYSYVLNNPLKYNDPTGELPLWALWGIASAGNWLFGGMDNWLNKGMSFKQSFSTANNPIVFSGNYHPGSNSWSNTQVNAHRLVGAMANSERGVHSYVAGFSGIGRNGEGPLFTSTPFDQFVGESPLCIGVAEILSPPKINLQKADVINDFKAWHNYLVSVNFKTTIGTDYHLSDIVDYKTQKTNKGILHDIFNSGMNHTPYTIVGKTRYQGKDSWYSIKIMDGNFGRPENYRNNYVTTFSVGDSQRQNFQNQYYIYWHSYKGHSVVFRFTEMDYYRYFLNIK